jgi:hypothetical protein
MDWGTVAILAAITWLDGVRRVPAGALVLRQVAGGRWTVADAAMTAASWRLVAWWSPVTLALVIPSGGIPTADAASDATDGALATRVSRSRRALLGTRVLGALVLVGIVFGVPAAAGRFGGWGFVVALAVVMLIATAATGAAFCAVMRLGRGGRRAARLTVHLLWPFSAPRAAELLLEHVVAGAAPLMVARELLGSASFAAWVRPRAYDALHDVAELRDASALWTVVGHSALAAIVDTAPAHCDLGERYCPRCARVYRAGIAACAECRGLRLVERTTT